MYIVFEYATCFTLTLIAGALLFGASVAFLLIQKGVRLLGGFARAFMRLSAPVMGPAGHLSMQGR